LQKFDPHMQYVKQWVPEWGTSAYPEPIVEHTWARNRALERFQLGLAL
jgi:deoxyribodipyrimidine photo-lyase